MQEEQIKWITQKSYTSKDVSGHKKLVETQWKKENCLTTAQQFCNVVTSTKPPQSKTIIGHKASIENQSLLLVSKALSPWQKQPAFLNSTFHISYPHKHQTFISFSRGNNLRLPIFDTGWSDCLWRNEFLCFEKVIFPSWTSPFFFFSSNFTC